MSAGYFIRDVIQYIAALIAAFHHNLHVLSGLSVQDVQKSTANKKKARDNVIYFCSSAQITYFVHQPLVYYWGVVIPIHITPLSVHDKSHSSNAPLSLEKLYWAINRMIA